MQSVTDTPYPIAERLTRDVLAPMKQAFTGKDEIIDLLGLGLVAGENVFLLGPPGTAKSALVQQLSARMDGRSFDYLLTRFTEPAELFGPFDIRRLREGDLVTNTAGMLPEASLVFLDELFNANSALLNSLLTALNERVFRRGSETRPLETLLFVGASNQLPEDDSLRALFDRFLLRVRSDSVPTARLAEVLSTGWSLTNDSPPASGLSFASIRTLQLAVRNVDVSPVRTALADIVTRLRRAGIPVSDRRAVRLQRAIAASALLSGRALARLSDLWVLRHTWDTVEQAEIIAALVEEATAAPPDAQDHPRARASGPPDAAALAGECEAIAAAADDPAARTALLDRLTILECRLQWITDPLHHQTLTIRTAAVRRMLEGE